MQTVGRQQVGSVEAPTVYCAALTAPPTASITPGSGPKKCESPQTYSSPKCQPFCDSVSRIGAAQ